MPQGTVGLRFNIDTSQAQTSVDDLSNSIVTLGQEIRNAEAAAAAGTGSWDEVARLYQSLNNATSARGQIMNQTRQAQAAQAQNNPNNVFSGQTAWMFQTTLNQITSGIIKSMDAALSAAKQRASGDYSGAAVTQVRAEGEITGQAIGAGGGAIVGGLLTAVTGQAWLIPLLAGLGAEFGKFLGGTTAKKLEADLAYSDQYKRAMSSIDMLNQNYGGAINQKTGEQNNTHGLEMHGRAAEATEGTGLTTQAFIQAMNQISAYGVKTGSQALDMAHIQALWSRFSGADLGTIQKYTGQSYRFGGDTGSVSTAYGALMAQNMGKGQFSEFLNSMSRILEEGIAKGFVRSSEEIAGNMQMLYKLSGGSVLWQGEQGAQRLSQMNNAIANATNLQSVEDVITFGVARELLGADNLDERKAQFMKYGGVGKYYTGTYVDEMQLLERGVSADLLKGQFESVSKLEGNNVAGIIERFKSMYGLNYTGAAQVYKMMDDAKKTGADGNTYFDFNASQYETQIRQMKTDPKYQSDSEKLQTAINKMTENLVNIGKFKFDSTEWAMLESQARDVEAIRGAIAFEREMPDVSRREAAYLPETGPGGAPKTHTITSLVSDEYGINDNAVIYNLERLSKAAGQTKDSNNQILGRRYNTEVFPLLENLNTNNTSKNIIELVYQLQRGHSEAVTGGEAGNSVGKNEFFDLNRKIDALIEALNENTHSDRRLSLIVTAEE